MPVPAVPTSGGSTLHVIVTLFEPFKFSNSSSWRARAVHAQLARLASTEGVAPWLCEVAYEDNSFAVAPSSRTVQLRWPPGAPPLWLKESCFNAVVRQLPQSWDAAAWLDAEVSIDDPAWALDTVRRLRAGADAVQLFSRIARFGGEHSGLVAGLRAGETYVYGKSRAPGYGWAYSKRALARLGGLFEGMVVGGGDNVIAAALLRNTELVDAWFAATAALAVAPTPLHPAFVAAALAYVRTPREAFVLDCLPTLARHADHGTMVSRVTLRTPAMEHLEPLVHLARGASGLLVPAPAMRPDTAAALVSYFAGRAASDAGEGGGAVPSSLSVSQSASQ